VPDLSAGRHEAGNELLKPSPARSGKGGISMGIERTARKDLQPPVRFGHIKKALQASKTKNLRFFILAAN
jgi:hypothetical protein